MEQILGICPIKKQCVKIDKTDRGVKSSTKKKLKTNKFLEKADKPLLEFKLTINGESRSYSSKKHAIESFEIKVPTYNYRIKHGWTIEEALGLISPPSKILKRKSVKVLIDKREVMYPSLSAACRAHKISYSKFSNRYHSLKMTIEQALGIESGVREHCKKVAVNVDGKRVIFESITKASKAFGVKMATVSKRINHYGFTIEQALNLDVPPKKSEYNFSGTIYLVSNLSSGKKYVGQTVKKVSERWDQHIESSKGGEKFNIESLPYAIWKCGLDNFMIEILEASISGDPRINAREKYWIKHLNTEAPNGYNLTAGGGSYSSGGRKYVFQGIEYPSRNELCRTYNVIPATFNQRIKCGWTMEQALEIVPPKSTKEKKSPLW
ncbi:GIY-YIG nuclease family protein [Colwellia sp. 20A7]|uniref:GIY-YIG nuclease family protein n=1 Tax=Colwellia sp. 20A7 TaxID=2689569 RepID=UPI001357671D|nr:GIY-YIG nuclease family protein [Colwellia sp. 20A7]